MSTQSCRPAPSRRRVNRSTCNSKGADSGELTRICPAQQGDLMDVAWGTAAARFPETSALGGTVPKQQQCARQPSADLQPQPWSLQGYPSLDASVSRSGRITARPPVDHKSMAVVRHHMCKCRSATCVPRQPPAKARASPRRVFERSFSLRGSLSYGGCWRAYPQSGETRICLQEIPSCSCRGKPRLRPRLRR